MTNIFIHEFHELLYILGACLMFLIITPQVLASEFRRKLLYVGILALFSVCYLSIEAIDVRVYALHLMPIAIILASMFEGALAGIATWLAFVCCGIFIVGTDWAANLSGNTVLLAWGLTFHYRSYRRSTLGLLLINGLAMLVINAVIYLTVSDWFGKGMDLETGTAILFGALLSTSLIIFTYYRVKNSEKLIEELFNAEKYQMMGQLAAAISHEVRNPLTMTSGFLQMMGKGSLHAETLERYRKHAIEGIDQATSIITDYLNYTKPAVEEARQLDVQAEIASLTPWIAPLAAMSGIEMRIYHHHDDPASFLGEPKKLQQCLLNLMKNAIEAMPDGGTLTIATKKTELDQVSITIADTGIGMSKMQLKRIGMPFFTTKEKGTGLGLMVVISLIHVMGGQIVFSSRRGQGTVCEIRFKLSDTAIARTGTE
ncbi:HAMP domain-containing histidine kinase [Paenibacillus rhizovicinus]|uniref:histidine kinase n=1 Tax=Paenibacillus rhizovicinus TaxID=2704463 RepID=A0A6C0NXL6_9BACL|nr:HAMP domain-containing sensor histidine kinase [Paenibacillus rhizovicinus]QHW30676.1 HAMP domain-containing histidine kinase [Paenibacillus rhizovicinus]